MLLLKPCCEHCGCSLPPDSQDARICSFECTFCAHCVETVLHNVCPNCGGGLERRPVRPQAKLAQFTASTERKHKPVEPEQQAVLIAKLGAIPPAKR